MEYKGGRYLVLAALVGRVHGYNEANVFCFLSSLPLLPQATTAAFRFYYLSSLYTYFIAYAWRGFVGPKKKTNVGLLVFNPL